MKRHKIEQKIKGNTGKNISVKGDLSQITTGIVHF